MRKQVEQRTVEESAERLLSLMKRKSKIKIAVEDACGEFHNGIPTVEIHEIDSEILKKIYYRKPDVKLENTYGAIFHCGCYDSKDLILKHAKKLEEIQIDVVLSE